MARYKKGIIGPLRGKVRQVVMSMTYLCVMTFSK